MRLRGRRFEVDKGEGKFLGVCAGIANHSGIDATIVRVALVLATLIGGWPWTVIAYFVVAFAGQPRRGVAPARGRIADTEESRERTRSLDLRMQAIETCVASSNSRLAREIEDLR